ncbi:Na/Pi cotransporter family protein [Herbaspirillum autotrophicum]|uniref:Na/Pi cotransporter family protein n=1 Tax=Herbaspirillum autotrophicum TaxID=180195 RepID=UPI00067DBDAC|nr:Na/Pi symporter [Herbaspirillum autotrophicum]
MSQFQIIIAAISSIVLFLYGLEGFSKELQATGGDRLRTWLARVTSNRYNGFVIGAFATVLIQSSSAVTSLATGLVDTGVLSLRSSLGILLGANVGTTATAWLVSFKLANIGPYFIVLGTVLSMLPSRAKMFGKSIFYFGLIFFALDLVSTELKPLQQQAWWASAIGYVDSPLPGLIVGALFTAIVQSSSVATGLAILLVQQGVLPAEGAIAIVIGANVGSTSTALIASLSMGRTAKAAALANLLFNACGALIVFPFLGAVSKVIMGFSDPAIAVALAHLCFNLFIGALFLPSLQWSQAWLMSLAARDAK